MTFGDAITFITLLLAGTGVFLVGVTLLTGNIEQLATSKIKSLFNKTADKKLVNVGIGAITTALIQSSGVTTILIVGFVNVGAMNLTQATAMIMGANIGTTITAQIAALSAFPFMTYVEALVFVGIMISMLTKKDRLKKVGLIMAGLGLIFIGLSIMSDSMKAYKSEIQVIFETVENPLLLFFIGIFLTALVQSSSATTSVIIAMSVAGLTIGKGGNEVLYIILGTNIGSCVTALMSSVGTSANAKRASVIHLLFNCTGSLIFFVIFGIFPNFMQNTFAKWFSSPATQIAMFHTFFNTICTVAFLPFTELFVKASKILVKDKKKKSEALFFDERMILSPMIAIAQLTKETANLADKAFSLFKTAFNAFISKDTSKSEEIESGIEDVVSYSQTITDFLIKLSANCKSEEDEKTVSEMHNVIGDILRIADIADNFVKYTAKECDKNLEFSPVVVKDLKVMEETLEKLFLLTKTALLDEENADFDLIAKTEDSVDEMRKRYIDDHIARLNKGECKPESSGVFINLVSNLERLGDHLTYIATAQKK